MHSAQVVVKSMVRLILQSLCPRCETHLSPIARGEGVNGAHLIFYSSLLMAICSFPEQICITFGHFQDGVLVKL